MLAEDTPRVKWESAKVIGNIAHLFPDKLDEEKNSIKKIYLDALKKVAG